MRYNTLNAPAHPPGKILNYVQVDVPKFEMFFQTLFFIGKSTFSLFGNYCYMFILIGLPTFYVMGSLILGIIGLLILYQVRLTIRHKLLEAIDGRLEFFKNVVRNLKYIKMRALENFYYFRIYRMREAEIYYYKVIGIVLGFISFTSWLVPSLPEISIFLHQAYFKIGVYKFSVLSAFIKLCHSLFDIMLILPYSINNLFDILISAKRIQVFLVAEEMDLSWIEYTHLSLGTANGNYATSG